jgi:hypothetical protein
MSVFTSRIEFFAVFYHLRTTFIGNQSANEH